MINEVGSFSARENQPQHSNIQDATAGRSFESLVKGEVMDGGKLGSERYQSLKDTALDFENSDLFLQNRELKNGNVVQRTGNHSGRSVSVSHLRELYDLVWCSSGVLSYIDQQTQYIKRPAAAVESSVANVFGPQIGVVRPEQGYCDCAESRAGQSLPAGMQNKTLLDPQSANGRGESLAYATSHHEYKRFGRKRFQIAQQDDGMNILVRDYSAGTAQKNNRILASVKDMAIYFKVRIHSLFINGVRY